MTTSLLVQIHIHCVGNGAEERAICADVLFSRLFSRYDIVKNERNKYVAMIQSSSQDLSEKKEKLKILQNEVHQVFSNITLNIFKGEFLYLIGDTGSGKSLAKA